MRRVRTSTWILLAVFLGTLVLYTWVKPPAPGTAGDSPAATANHLPGPVYAVPKRVRRRSPHARMRR